jgi:hypothetical protein
VRLTPNQLEEIYCNQKFITSDKFIVAALGKKFNFTKRDYIFRPGRYRGKVIFPIWAKPWKYIGKSLVVGASDYQTDFKEIVYLKRFKVRKIYGTNTINIKNVSESVPLGLTSNSNESRAHVVFGNTEHLNIANSLSPLREEFDGSIYVNFSVENNSRVRGELISILKNLKDVKYDEFSISDNSRISYLDKLRKYSLVPCPEGNGIDTHRLWETLYMGGTPVIIRSDYLPKSLNFLPVIQLNNWNEISDRSLMESYWSKIKDTNYNFSYLDSSFWISRFEHETLKSEQK